MASLNTIIANFCFCSVCSSAMNVFNETIERYGTVPLFVCLCVWRTNQAEPTRDSDANKTRTCGRFNVGVFWLRFLDPVPYYLQFNPRLSGCCACSARQKIPPQHSSINKGRWNGTLRSLGIRAGKLAHIRLIRGPQSPLTFASQSQVALCLCYRLDCVLSAVNRFESREKRIFLCATWNSGYSSTTHHFQPSVFLFYFYITAGFGFRELYYKLYLKSKL